MMSSTEKKQRKRFKRPKKAKEAKPKPKKREFPNKPKTCHQIHRGRCDVHDKPCTIIVAYPRKDSRNAWRTRLEAMGAERHDRDSEHRCIECEKERVENSPFKQIEVEGLDAAQTSRLKREAEAWNHRFIHAGEGQNSQNDD
jgi:hypothetical protein